MGCPWGFDAHYELDSLGRPVSLTQGGVERAGWGYDADGRGAPLLGHTQLAVPPEPSGPIVSVTTYEISVGFRGVEGRG